METRHSPLYLLAAQLIVIVSLAPPASAGDTDRLTPPASNPSIQFDRIEIPQDVSKDPGFTLYVERCATPKRSYQFLLVGQNRHLYDVYVELTFGPKVVFKKFISGGVEPDGAQVTTVMLDSDIATARGPAARDADEHGKPARLVVTKLSRISK
jgi:hypothetical protein